jgi:hypothetical protein
MAPTVTTTVPHATFAVSAYRGASVHNYAGQLLGKVDDFTLDFDSGRIAYVIVSVGGFLGIGDKLYAVPWEFFAIRPDEHAFYVDIEKELLLDGPNFEHGQWPDVGDTVWIEQIRAHYAQKPYWNSDVTDAGDYVGDDLIDKPNRDRIPNTLSTDLHDQH